MNKDSRGTLLTVDHLRRLLRMLRLTRRTQSRLRSPECRITDRLAYMHLRIPRHPVSLSRSDSHLAPKAQASLERMGSLELMEGINSGRSETTGEEDGFPRRFTEASSRRTGSRLQGSRDHLNSLLVGQAFPEPQDTANTGNDSDVAVKL